MDIAYCTSKSCTVTDCRRHPIHAPVGVPVTIADMDEKDENTGGCLYYWPSRAPQRKEE